MQVEDTSSNQQSFSIGRAKDSLSRVCLTSRRTTEQERHLSIGNGLLRQVIVHYDGVLSVITKEFPNTTLIVKSAFIQPKDDADFVCWGMFEERRTCLGMQHCQRQALAS